MGISSFAEIAPSVSPGCTVYVMGVGEGGTVAVGVGNALSNLLATSKVGVAAGSGRESLGVKRLMTTSTVAAETTTFNSRKGRNCRQVGRRTLPTAADHSIGWLIGVLQKGVYIPLMHFTQCL